MCIRDRGLSFEGYSAAINALNALIETADVKPVRFIAIVAIQRSIATVFPEDRSDQLLREQLIRAKDRFPEIRLEDSKMCIRDSYDDVRDLALLCGRSCPCGVLEAWRASSAPDAPPPSSWSA